MVQPRQDMAPWCVTHSRMRNTCGKLGRPESQEWSPWFDGLDVGSASSVAIIHRALRWRVAYYSHAGWSRCSIPLADPDKDGMELR